MEITGEFADGYRESIFARRRPKEREIIIIFKSRNVSEPSPVGSFLRGGVAGGLGDATWQSMGPPTPVPSSSAERWAGPETWGAM